MDNELGSLPVTRLAHLKFSGAESDWLIDGLWAANGVGCVGGPPKIGKTWVALEMAFAVASGTACMGRFPCRTKGPVLVYCVEDGPRSIQQRMAGIAKARNVDFEQLLVGWIGGAGIFLDDLKDRRRLAMTIAEKKPKMVVLDPLVRLHRGDENSSAVMADILGYLRDLQREYQTAIVLVHHMRKSSVSEPGLGLRGSGDLHAWGDSNVYLLYKDGQPMLNAEHRAHRSLEPMPIRLDGDPPRLVVPELGQKEAPGGMEARVLALLAETPLNRTALRDRLHVRNETLGTVLERLVAEKRIVKLQDGELALVIQPKKGTERNAP